ncbi:Arc family DNA-binding protein [Pseudorhodoferax sp. LjRoot39]|uniref:FitA-like ribbon-helix-helix domain-containing protein n=1 Tax=Pseudorhodoferax sp. LjRoot39 TaxID=3342328 RepID=UPI003ECFD56B
MDQIQCGAKMPNLSVKDVPEAWAEALRQRAARNHRSLQGELMAILEGAVGGTPAPAAKPVAQVQGWKTVAQIAAELRAKYPKPITGVSTGRDIIRAERDAR